jgi:hypothetical protein
MFLENTRGNAIFSGIVFFGVTVFFRGLVLYFGYKICNIKLIVMKKSVIAIAFILITQVGFSQQTAWKIVEGRIQTPWAEKVNPLSVLAEYPRPQMVRDPWMSLNGLWDYAIKQQGDAVPTAFDGKILVPFAIESALSGVGKNVGKENHLWYRRTLSIPSSMKNKTVLLHFEGSRLAERCLCQW